MHLPSGACAHSHAGTLLPPPPPGISPCNSRARTHARTQVSSAPAPFSVPAQKHYKAHKIMQGTSTGNVPCAGVFMLDWCPPLCSFDRRPPLPLLSDSYCCNAGQAALHLPEAGAVQAGGAAATSGATSAAVAARGMWAHVPEVRSAGVGGRVAALWTGVGATLARDVPFSAIYWQVRHLCALVGCDQICSSK